MRALASVSASIRKYRNCRNIIDSMGSRQALFNQHIVDATKDIALAYKPNIAFYPGRSGLDQLVRTVQIIRDIAPNVPVILRCETG